MTAEIAVLNKDAVALAADSTVTISGKKTYHTTNKLFALSKYHPVGVMIYGSGELAGIPWETLIKVFRNKLGKRSLSNLRLYKDEFISFIEKDISQYNLNDQKEMLLEYAENYIEVFLDEINRSVKELFDTGVTVEKILVKEMVNSKINLHHRRWASEKKLSGFDNEHIQSIKKKFKTEFLNLITEKFENHELTASQRNKLISIFVNIFSTKFTEISGVVFAGFGEDELFPVLVTCQIECMIEKKLKYEEDLVEIKNEIESSAAIVPFAQTDIVSTFMGGISDRLKHGVMSCLEHAIGDYSDELASKMKKNGVSAKKIDASFGLMRDKRLEIERKIVDTIAHLQYEYHIRPVVEAVQFLPKNEMAEVAEALVSITSFRQKISLEQESVGGAIDVAVISKSDGFVWIKRKHYFQPDLNPMYFNKINSN